VIYLYHKDHGVHIAYTEQEVERCKLNGWVEKQEEKKTLTLPKRKEKSNGTNLPPE
jgi:hypothetical protein